MKYLIVGLGNIGMEYDSTRHNIGFDIADALVIRHGGQFRQERLAFVAACRWKGRTMIVIKPTTYMNLSGRAVKYWMEKEKIPQEHLLVLMDDLALPLEAMRLRAGGSHAGHNGLKDIDQALQSNQYPRLRFGIGNDFPRGRQVDFVLGKWNRSELPIIMDKIPRALDAIECFCTEGLQAAMNKFNN